MRKAGVGWSASRSAVLTATTNSDTVQNEDEARGVRLVLNVTAASGSSPTLDVKLQRYDDTSANWIDLPSAAFAQKTGVSNDDLVVYPGVAETANRSVSDVITSRWRAVATIAGSSPSFSFTVTGEYIL